MGAYLRRAEDLGFESALLIDHLLVAPPAYRTTWLEPISLLSALSGVTRTMRLGTLVLVLPFRDPVAFAKEWATFDLLSGGRSILGVGVGWHPGEFSALRIPIKERGRRMNEMLESITALWAGDDVSYEGQFYRFEGLTIDPKPAQRPHPPIWIGGGTQPSEKIYGQAVDTIRPVLRRIAKYASTWVPHSSATAEMVAGDWAIIREEMAGFGRDPDEMTKVYSNFIHVLAPGESPDSAASRFRVFSGMPPIETILVEDTEPAGPFGAKGVGEPALIPTAPAILGAIRHATGARVDHLPATPARVRTAIREIATSA